MTTRYRRISGFGNHRNPAETLELFPPPLGQSCPQHYPQQNDAEDNPLGVPLTIRETARLIGCSPWTVRQKHVPRGLPHFRSGANGKLIFYREQVIAWILAHQQKGGTTK